jgi:MoxR-like ATPase
MILSTTKLSYQGEKLNETVKLRYKLPNQDELEGKVAEKSSKDKKIEEVIPAYFPSKELVAAVEYARLLQRPLLLRGEPGCGKTRLAQALAYEMYGQNYRRNYFEWYVKSTTKVNEGLYQFDHLARLRDANMGSKSETTADAEDIKKYRKFGALGKAFLYSTPQTPAVLLIDEIDKADLDFPNDLLLELDQKRFFIPETREEIIAKQAPIIIITSNDEKDLPGAFLRRCVFHYIDFPNSDDLFKIVSSKAKAQENHFEIALPDALIESIITQFVGLRKKMAASQTTDKLPSTSELLDWLRVIHYYYFTDKPRLKLAGNEALPNELLFPEVLLKTLDDYKTNKII